MFGFRGFPGVQGGVETHAEHLAPQLAQLGHDVTVFFRSPYVPSDCGPAWKGVRLRRIWSLQNACVEALLHSLICALIAGIQRPRLVHVHGIGPALVTPLLRLLGLRVVVTHHGEDYNREKWGGVARMVLKLGEAVGMRFANKRIVISRHLERLIADKYALSCDVIPNGVTLPALPKDADQVTALGLEPGRYVLSVGRLVPEKRQLDLLRAFTSRDLPDHLRGWKLAIVGRIDHQNDYAEALMAEAASSDNVVMAGLHSGESLRQLYAHAGLFVLPSSHEGLPLVLLEALSYGLPVLVSDIAANVEVVDHADHIFRLGDIDNLRAKMASLTQQPRDAAARETLRRAAIRRYDWRDIALRTSAAYMEVAGERSTEGRPTGGVLRPAAVSVSARPRYTAWSEFWRSLQESWQRTPEKESGAA